MSEKGGMGSVPILPQNMLAVKEENPRRFYGQCCYLVWWFVLCSLFIVYASFNLKDYLETQDQPVITSRIKRAERLEYPVFLICPFQPLPLHAYYRYGLFIDARNYGSDYIGYYYDENNIQENPSRTVIDVSGGVKGGNSDDKSEGRKSRDGLNPGNTGSIFPEKKLCNGQFATKSESERKKLNDLQDKVADNMQALYLTSLVGIQGDQPTYDGYEQDNKDEDAEGYYTCILFNADRELTDEDRDRLADPFSGKKECGNSRPRGGKDEDKKTDKKSEKDSNRAYATDVGYYDGYVMIIRTFWRYDDKNEPDDLTILSLSITIANNVDEIEPTAAEYASLGVPVGTTSAIFLKRIEFICEECEDDEFVVFYNATLNLIDLHNYPAVPQPRRVDNSIVAYTQIQVFFESMTITTQQEVITQGPLDYLGNFAGMLGTLLAFSVLGSVDRLCSYVFIGNGAKASVWDE